MIKKDQEKHLPPVKKRTAGWFFMATGSAPNSLRGHGGRSGKGAMAARIQIETVELAPVTPENLVRHFAANNHYRQSAILGDGSEITRKEFLQIGKEYLENTN